MTSTAAELRRALLTFVLSILVLETVAIGTYYGARIPSKPERIQHVYLGVWMAVTMIIVVRNLTIMRKFRVRNPRVPR